MATGLPKTKWRNHANGSPMISPDNEQNRQGMDYTLHYVGKQPYDEVLATPPDQPHLAFSVGESSADEWRNRLYLGDNVWNRPYESWTPERIAKEYPYVDEATGRRYKRVPLHAPGVRNGETGKPWRDMLPPPGKHWQFPPATLEEMDKRGEIYWSPNGNPRRKVFLDQSEGVSVQDIWLEFRDAHNQNVHVTGYPTEKNPDLLARMIGASSQAEDLVLDCFCGSGTTLAVAEMIGRRWIGVDNSPEAITTTLTRLAKGTQPMGDFVGKRGNGQSQTQPQSIALTLFAEEDVPTVDAPKPIRSILRSSLDLFIAESAAETVTPEMLAGWRHLFEAPPTTRESRATYSVKSHVTLSQNKRKVTLQEKNEGRTR